MYRYVRQTPLDTGHKCGDILKDGDLKPETIKLFLEKGTLVRVTTPPLTEIPKFEKRVEALARADILTIDDLVMANPTKVAKKVLKAQSTIRRWQAEAMAYLSPPQIEDDG